MTTEQTEHSEHLRQDHPPKVTHHHNEHNEGNKHFEGDTTEKVTEFHREVSTEK